MPGTGLGAATGHVTKDVVKEKVVICVEPKHWLFFLFLFFFYSSFLAKLPKCRPLRIK